MCKISTFRFLQIFAMAAIISCSETNLSALAILKPMSNLQISLDTTKNTNSKKILDLSTISLGGIKLSMSKEEVTSILGLGGEVIWDANGDELELYHKGIKINLAGNGVYSIEVTSPRYATGGGVRIGDSINDARKVYSRYEPYESTDTEGFSLLQYAEHNEAPLTFKYYKGIIHGISLANNDLK